MLSQSNLSVCVPERHNRYSKNVKVEFEVVWSTLGDQNQTCFSMERKKFAIRSELSLLFIFNFSVILKIWLDLANGLRDMPLLTLFRIAKI